MILTHPIREHNAYKAADLDSIQVGEQLKHYQKESSITHMVFILLMQHCRTYYNNTTIHIYSAQYILSRSDGQFQSNPHYKVAIYLFRAIWIINAWSNFFLNRESQYIIPLFRNECAHSLDNPSIFKSRVSFI